LNQTPPFASGEVIPGVGRDSELAEATFAAEVGEVGGPRATTRGWIVWQVAEVQEAGVPPLEEIRPQVTAKVRRQRALELVSERGERLAEQWRASGADPPDAAEAEGGSVSSVTEHRRGTTVKPVNTVLAPLDALVFAAEVGDVVGPVEVPNRGVLIARVTGMNRVDAQELEANLPSTRQRMRAERGRELLQSIVNERRREEVVTVNQRLVDRFAPATG
jgi:peptidyl-prolyl cis-trans isomerase D